MHIRRRPVPQAGAGYPRTVPSLPRRPDRAPLGTAGRLAASVAAVLTLLLTAAGCTTAAAGSGAAATPTSFASASTPPTTPAAPPPAASSTPDAQRELFVWGDSYAAGDGADSPSNSFAFRLGDLLGWPTQVNAMGGTGYIDPGDYAGSDRTYSARLALVPGTIDADLVVVEGGFNDRDRQISQVGPAATAFFQALRVKAPNARIVAVGAMAPDPTEPQLSAAVNAVIAQAARAQGVAFIDPVAENWITVDNAATYVALDGRHPSDAGHAYFASRLAADLQPLLVF